MLDYYHQPLEYDRYFHIYNRGINSSILFKREVDSENFLNKYIKYIEPIAETFAWCLIKNHFHILVKVKAEKQIEFIKPKAGDSRKFAIKKKYDPTSQFSHLFNSYTKSFNFNNNRTGGLFENSFRRIMIEDDNYLKQMVYYIHYNPVKHGLVSDLFDYKWSSYRTMLSGKPTNLKREDVLEWFGSKDSFIDYHESKLEIDKLYKYNLEEH